MQLNCEGYKAVNKQVRKRGPGWPLGDGQGAACAGGESEVSHNCISPHSAPHGLLNTNPFKVHSVSPCSINRTLTFHSLNKY